MPIGERRNILLSPQIFSNVEIEIFNFHSQNLKKLNELR